MTLQILSLTLSLQTLPIFANLSWALLTCSVAQSLRLDSPFMSTDVIALPAQTLIDKESLYEDSMYLIKKAPIPCPSAINLCSCSMSQVLTLPNLGTSGLWWCYFQNPTVITSQCALWLKCCNLKCLESVQLQRVLGRFSEAKLYFNKTLTDIEWMYTLLQKFFNISDTNVWVRQWVNNH